MAGLVLAAGEGRRLGRPKALVRHRGRLLVDRAAGLLRDGGCRPVAVVLGAAAERVRAEAELAGCAVVVNPDWPTGMGSSLRAGLAALADGPAAAVVVALVDQPGVGAAAVRRLVAAWQGGAAVAVATYGGQPRNPVLLDRSVWPAVAAEAVGDRGARRWLAAHPERVTAVACDDTGSPHDVDTPEDLAALEG